MITASGGLHNDLVADLEEGLLDSEHATVVQHGDCIRQEYS